MIRRPHLSIGGGSAGLVKDHTFTFFWDPSLICIFEPKLFFFSVSHNHVISNSKLGKGPKKNVKVWSLTKVGGGSPETKPLLQKLKSFILSVCPLSCPIRGEIIDSSVLV